MSTIDLSKLTARKKFFIPIKSSALNELIWKQLELDPHAWRISVERPKSGTMSLLWSEEWARMRCIDESKPFTKPNLDEYRAEFEKDMLDKMEEMLNRWMDNVPVEIHFVVVEETSGGCVCEITCFPLVRHKILRNLSVECGEAGLQDARLRCEEFLVDIFVGGLGGKEIAERREVTQWELLINDIDCHHITERVYQMLEQAVGEVSIMGWVGTDCLPKLKELRSKGVTIQAVTHKPSELKSPVPKDIQEGYTNLVKILGKMNVSTNRQLHGRAIVVDNKALIGSMDLNAHSLSGEHKEFAVYTDDVDTVRKLRTYFREIFVPL